MFAASLILSNPSFPELPIILQVVNLLLLELHVQLLISVPIFPFQLSYPYNYGQNNEFLQYLKIHFTIPAFLLYLRPVCIIIISQTIKMTRMHFLGIYYPKVSKELFIMKSICKIHLIVPLKLLYN